MKQKIWCHSCLINLQAVCWWLNEKTGRMMAFRKRGRERECGWLQGFNMPTFNLGVDTSQLHKSTYSPDYCWSCGENLITMEIWAADSVLWESEIIKITNRIQVQEHSELSVGKLIRGRMKVDTKQLRGSGKKITERQKKRDQKLKKLLSTRSLKITWDVKMTRN